MRNFTEVQKWVFYILSKIPTEWRKSNVKNVFIEKRNKFSLKSYLLLKREIANSSMRFPKIFWIYYMLLLPENRKEATKVNEVKNEDNYLQIGVP